MIFLLKNMCNHQGYALARGISRPNFYDIGFRTYNLGTTYCIKTNEVLTIINLLTISTSVGEVYQEHGTVRQCQPTSATSTSQIDVIQRLRAATATV